MNKLTLAIGIALIPALIALNVQAQERTGVRKPTRAKVELRSKADDIPVLVAKSSARNAPAWTSPSVKRAGAAGAGTTMSLAAPPKSELENLTLTVRKVYTAHGSLMFRQATINPDSNYAFWAGDLADPSRGTVAAGLHVKKGERYLLDFELRANFSTTFTFKVGGAAHDVKVDPGEHHLLAYLDATETTRVVALLKSDTANYVFYSFEVTRVD